jgi:O-antigen ligase
MKFELEELACFVVLYFYGIMGYLAGAMPRFDALAVSTTVDTGAEIVGIGIQLIADLLVLILVLGHYRTIRARLTTARWTMPFAILVLASTLWSQDPSITARRGVGFVLATLFALYFANRYSLQTQVKMLWQLMILLSVLSIIFAVFAPQFGLTQDTGGERAGDWMGVFTQKNGCARAMCFAIALAFARGKRDLAGLASIALFLFVLVMTRSRAGWAVAVAFLGLYLFLKALNKFDTVGRRILAATFGIVAMSGAVLVYVFADKLLPMVGRDSSLTGRTAIWQQVWLAIWERPLLGYGYSAFWLGPKGRSFDIVAAVGWMVPHAHNGLLEVWLEVGGIGLALLCISYLSVWHRLWPSIVSGDIRRFSWLIYLLFLTFAWNLEETSLLVFNGIFWVLYVAAISNIEVIAAARQTAPESAPDAGLSWGGLTTGGEATS